MHGADHQVTGLGGADGHFDGLEITQLSDDHDVRIFAQRAFERRRKGAGVLPHLTLGYVATNRLLHDFHRIFHRDDVILAVLVQFVNQCGQSRGLAGAHRTGDEHQTIVVGK